MKPQITTFFARVISLAVLSACALIFGVGAQLLAQADAPASAPATGPATRPAAPQFKLNQKVEVKIHSRWREALVLNFRNDWYLIRYTEFPTDREWVEPWRIREIGSTVDELGWPTPNNRKAEQGPPPQKPGPAVEPMFKKNPAAEANRGDIGVETKSPDDYFWPDRVDPGIRKDPAFRRFKLIDKFPGTQSYPVRPLTRFDGIRPVAAMPPKPVSLGNTPIANAVLYVSANGRYAVVFSPARYGNSLGGTLKFIDIQNNRIINEVTSAENALPLAISPNGTRVAVRMTLGSDPKKSASSPERLDTANDPTEEDQPVVSIWTLKTARGKTEFVRESLFLPYAGQPLNGVLSATFCDESRILFKSKGRRTMLVDMEQNVRCQMQFRGSHSPSITLSPNRRFLALDIPGSIVMIDLETLTVTARYETPQFRNYTFTPSGRDLILRDADAFCVLNLSNGEITTQFAAFNVYASHMAALSEIYFIADDGVIVDVATASPLWRYTRGNSGEQSWDYAAGMVWALAPDANQQTVLAAARLPTDEAVNAQPKDLDSSLAIRPGRTISMSIDAGGETESVRQELRKKLEANGLKIVDGKADLSLQVKTVLGKPTEIAFHDRRDIRNFNDPPINRTVTDYTITLEILSDGNTVYKHSYGSNLTLSRNVILKPNQTLDQAIQEMTTPRYDSVKDARIPKYYAAPDKPAWRGTSPFPVSE